ncbi:uncharacterized protein LOC136090020 [Hydra vulgaris]|uniref:Uncharacterized protein LOC136090020 n=1 Tax=Hydra vulgaris TaxID=6087 RepID=A0ABM4DCT6_HYDVU
MDRKAFYDNVRLQIVGLLKDKTKTQQEIAQICNVSLKFVQTTLKNHKLRNDVKDLPRLVELGLFGHLKLTSRDQSYLYQKKVENVLTPNCVLCKRLINNSCECNLWENDAVFKKFTAQSILEISSSSLLLSIFSGQLYSYRHNIYNSGGKAKRNLINQDLMYLLSEDIKDNLIYAISKSFNSLKTSDYTFKVLLPEAILYLFAKLEGFSRIKAEVLLSTYSLQRQICNIFIITSLFIKQKYFLTCTDKKNNLAVE